jgi:hypothetical protein
MDWREKNIHEDEYVSPDLCSHLITPLQLNDLIRDLNLSKIKAEIFASRLQEWNLLERNFKTCLSQPEKAFLPLFSSNGRMFYCNNADGLLKSLEHDHTREERRLLIDASKINLKGVLLHTGN